MNKPSNAAEAVRKTTTDATVTEGIFKEATPLLDRREKAPQT